MPAMFARYIRSNKKSKKRKVPAKRKHSSVSISQNADECIRNIDNVSINRNLKPLPCVEFNVLKEIGKCSTTPYTYRYILNP